MWPCRVAAYCRASRRLSVAQSSIEWARYGVRVNAIAPGDSHAFPRKIIGCCSRREFLLRNQRKVRKAPGHRQRRRPLWHRTHPATITGTMISVVGGVASGVNEVYHFRLSGSKSNFDVREEFRRK
jgi:NAD(P)-dependent dehydrogenase (short-subunit alcohol dehydrogenase family)